MVIAADVVLSAHRAVQRQLRTARPGATPWPDVAFGSDDGAGYNFSNRTLRPFIKACYGLMQADPALAEVSQRFALPHRLPIANLLAGNVTNFERWTASDVCGQLGL